MVDSFEALDKMGGMKGVVIQDNIHDDKTIGKLSQINIHIVYTILMEIFQLRFNACIDLYKY